jgi:hypothetical protein
MRIADAHRGDGKRYVVHADENLTPFIKLEQITGVALARKRWMNTVS